MNNIFTYFILLNIFFSPISLGQVSSVCELDQSFSDISISYEGLKGFVCSEVGVSSSQEIQALGAEVLEIARYLHKEELSSSKKKDAEFELFDALGAFKDALNRRDLIVQESPQEEGELGGMLVAFFSKFSDPNYRTANKEQYFENTLEILRRTQSASGLVGCLATNPDPKVTSFKINFSDDLDEPDAFVSLNPNEDDNHTYKAELTFKPATLAPHLVLPVVAHELYHVCMGTTHHNSEQTQAEIFEYLVGNASKRQFISEKIDNVDVERAESDQAKVQVSNAIYKKHEDFINSERDPPLELYDYFRNRYGDDYIPLMEEARKLNFYRADLERSASQDVLLEEIKGFHTQTLVFEELAKYLPRSFCGPRILDSMYSDVISNGQLHSNFQVQLQNGSFAKTLVQSYLDINRSLSGYSPEHFYLNPRSENKAFWPEFQRKIDALSGTFKTKKAPTGN